jgi:uncharacterized protein
LALNAEQVSGLSAERELPVVWAVFKGSALNKLILVPLALGISAWSNSLVMWLLMLGGAFLCFEGFEKIAHGLMQSKEEEQTEHDALIKAVNNPNIDLLAFEKEKIKGAIRVDFILSAEIVAIALSTVATQGLMTKVWVLSAIAAFMTVGVYGAVACIVKIDDLGFYLAARTTPSFWGKVQRQLGALILKIAPYLMKTLSMVGTAAVFLVGGGILVHGWPAAHHFIEGLSTQAAQLPVLGLWGTTLPSSLLNAAFGLAAGAVVWGVWSMGRPLFKLIKK